MRYTIRRHVGELADPLDQEEVTRTRSILDAGGLGLGMALVAAAAGRPGRFWAAFWAALKLARYGGRGLFVHLVYLAEACLLRQWLAAEGIEHLHAHFGTNPAAVAMLCRILGGPAYSFTVHGPDEFDRAPALRLDMKTHHAAFVVAISQYGKSQLCRWVAPADYGKLQIIHCGLDDCFLTGSGSAVDRKSVV